MIFAMNISVLKSDFYKRFDTSDNFLVTQKCGMLCTLLGFCDIRGAMSLTATLSMGVNGVCRKLSGDVIQITNNDSGDLLRYYTKDFELGTSLSGAQILLDNSIPDYLPSLAETKICTLKCIMRLNHISDFDKVVAASMCCGEENIKPYLALLEARHGYGVVSHKLNTSPVPLPMSGYKYICVQFDTPPKQPDIKEAEKMLDLLSQRYPHVSTFSDLDDEVLRYAITVTNNKETIRRLAYLVNETKRISCAVTVLKSMHIRDLFEIINESAMEYEQLWGADKNIRALLAFSRVCDGVRAARPFHNGIICIADEHMVDHVAHSFKEQLRYYFKSNIRFCISD